MSILGEYVNGNYHVRIYSDGTKIRENDLDFFEPACKYLDGIFLRNYRPTNMRVYNHSTYLFRDTKLITVLPLPRNLWKLADKLQARSKEAAK